jgi:hypothetical protein
MWKKLGLLKKIQTQICADSGLLIALPDAKYLIIISLPS